MKSTRIQFETGPNLSTVLCVAAAAALLALLLGAPCAHAYDCDGEDCGEEEITVPDIVGRSLDKAIITRRGGQQDTLHLAPGSGTSYVFPGDTDKNQLERDKRLDRAEEVLTW